MSSELDGRRIALFGADEGDGAVASTVAAALDEAGATVQHLRPEQQDSEWHGGKYAALAVVIPDGDGTVPPGLIQLIREFLASEKPVAAWGDGVRAVVEAGGAAGRTIAAGDSLMPGVKSAGGTLSSDAICVDGPLLTARGNVTPAAFSAEAIRAFGRELDEAAVDEMSDLSFPASDPPSSSPGTAGQPARQSGEARGRA